MKFNKLIAILTLLLFGACDSSQPLEFRPRDHMEGPLVIDLSIIEENRYSPDSLFNNIRFIKLETNNQCLIASYDKITVYKDTIFILSNSDLQKAIFAFNINGDYLFKIDSRGRGPGEYSDISDFYINDELQYIGVLSYSKVIKYNFSGEYIEKTLDLSHCSVLRINYQDGNLYAFAPDGTQSGSKSMSFAAFNREGDLIYRDLPELKSSLFYGFKKNNYLSSNSTHTYFNLFASDTIYQVTEGFLSPKYILDFGIHKIPIEIQNSFLKQDIPDHKTVEYLIKNRYVIFGLNYFYVLDDYIILGVPLGNNLELAVYCSNLRTTRIKDSNSKLGILIPVIKGSFANTLIGVIDPLTINWLKNYEKHNLITDQKSDFFFRNLKNYRNINESDNGVLVMFDIK